MLDFNDDPMTPQEAEKAKLVHEFLYKFGVIPRNGKGVSLEAQCQKIRAALASGKPDRALMPRKPGGPTLD